MAANNLIQAVNNLGNTICIENSIPSGYELLCQVGKNGKIYRHVVPKKPQGQWANKFIFDTQVFFDKEDPLQIQRKQLNNSGNSEIIHRPVLASANLRVLYGKLYTVYNGGWQRADDIYTIENVYFTHISIICNIFDNVIQQASCDEVNVIVGAQTISLNLTYSFMGNKSNGGQIRSYYLGGKRLNGTAQFSDSIVHYGRHRSKDEKQYYSNNSAKNNYQIKIPYKSFDI